MLLADLVDTSQQVAATRSRRTKIDLLAGCLRNMAADEVAVGASYLAGAPRQERLDLGPAALRDVHPVAAGEASLTLTHVDRVLQDIADAHGRGSRGTKLDLLANLLAAATDLEQDFLRALVIGELRQGALEAVVAQAVAAAFDIDEGAVRRAVMLRGDLGAVAAAAATGGATAVAEFRLTLFRPLQPMLAQTAADLDGALGGVEPAAAEYKLDGARVQVHRGGGDVRVFTRNLRDVTARLGEVVAAVAALPGGDLVLDGEVLALTGQGRPRRFQDTMRRFGSDELPDADGDLTLSAYFFDCLHLDGEDLLDRPLVERHGALEGVVPAEMRVPRRVVDGADAARDLLEEAIRQGHEGLMVKDLASTYEAGRRGAAWRKVKPVHTLDLVVLAAEWGHGRRKGWLSNIHLGARDPDGGGFVMLGKTFKGMTDEMLEWQTRRFLELERGRDGHVVHLDPEVVAEVAFDGVQASPRYPGGFALRFARVKRYRADKRPADADTLDTIRAIHLGERLPPL